jgi:ADP-ribosylglycohydrolase/catechol 2,3-dioxygenase-like lactoylglutathione lyase family enzyme
MESLMTTTDQPVDPELLDRATGAFLGAAVGDALGWPVENRSGRVGGRRDLEPSFRFIAWRRREGGRYQPHEEEISPGSYSDDTQLMLAVARARLIEDEWWRWLTEMELPMWLLYERGGGGATKRAAAVWAGGRPPWSDENAKRYFEAGGNGAAMRITSHCLVGASFDEVAAAVVADGIATHGHPRALVGALLQAYAVHCGLSRRDVLGYGELINEVLATDAWRRFAPPDQLGTEWEDGASDAMGKPYRDIWNEVVEETEQMLLTAREGIARGALAVDKPVLDKVGAFGKSSGAGTVTAVGAVFLASRYAAQPSSGIVAASFAKGADTDTLAAMTGAILGAVHGTDWLATMAREVEDGSYIRRLASDLVYGRTVEYDVDGASRPPTTRTFWRGFGEPDVGAQVELPGGGWTGTVIAVTEHETKRADLLPVTWAVQIDNGPTLHFKRVKKVKPQPEEPSSIPPKVVGSDVQGDRRPRFAIVLHVGDIRQARSFYEDVVGLRVSKESAERIIFAGLIALEALPRSLRNAGSEQLAFETSTPQPSFDTKLALRLYVHKVDFDVIRQRIADAALPLSEITHNGPPSFRCHDPEGNVIEFRSMNGG